MKFATHFSSCHNRITAACFVRAQYRPWSSFKFWSTQGCGDNAQCASDAGTVCHWSNHFSYKSQDWRGCGTWRVVQGVLVRRIDRISVILVLLSIIVLVYFCWRLSFYLGLLSQTLLTIRLAHITLRSMLGHNSPSWLTMYQAFNCSYNCCMAKARILDTF